MSFHPTQTSKDILSNEEAVLLAHRLRDTSLHTQRLALALYQSATPLLIEVIETLIQQVNHQLSTSLLEQDEQTLNYLTDTAKHLRGRGLLQDTRTVIPKSVNKLRTKPPENQVLSVTAPIGGFVSRVRKPRGS